MLPRKNSKGFTLIELMVVITIISILSLAGIVIYTNVQKGARDSRRRADIDSIAKAMEVHNDNSTGQYAQVSADWFSAGTVPRDPKNVSYIIPSGFTNIFTISGATSWRVCADLEGVTPAGATVNWDGTQQDSCLRNTQ